MHNKLADVDVKTISAPECSDWYECVCGNDPESEGFQPCDVLGNPIDLSSDSAMATWDQAMMICMRCGLVMDQRSYDPAAHTVVVIGRSRVFVPQGS